MRISITRKYFNSHVNWVLAVMNAIKNEPLPADALTDLDQSVAAVAALDWDSTCKLLASQTPRAMTIGWNEAELTFDISDAFLEEALACYEPEQVGKVIGLTLNLIGHGTKLGESVIAKRAEVDARWK